VVVTDCEIPHIIRKKKKVCVIFCIVWVYMCIELRPPGGYPIAVKYIIYNKNKVSKTDQGTFSRVYIYSHSRLFCPFVSPTDIKQNEC